jgi:Protein kinase domain
VFRAYDAERERLVAIKLFKLDLPPERVHQLVGALERVIAAELTHPALAAPLATGIAGVEAYLVQDYVGAESLDLAVREYGPAQAPDALRVATQLAGALDFAAAASIVHGSLHPRDILLSTDDTRLTGIGVARALAVAGITAPVRRPYSAPERIEGATWDRRADVFSLAALVHELMWGRRIAGVGAQAAQSLTEIVGGDLAALRATFERGLAADPDARFATALEFAEALQNGLPGVTAAPVAPPAKKRSVRKDDRPPRVDPPMEVEPKLPLDALVGPTDELIRDAEQLARKAASDFDLLAAENRRFADVDGSHHRGSGTDVGVRPDAIRGLAARALADRRRGNWFRRRILHRLARSSGADDGRGRIGSGIHADRGSGSADA